MAALKKFVCISNISACYRIPYRTHYGYMPFEGPVVPKDTPRHQLFAELKKINLKPVTRIHFKFDPLHPKAKNIRDVMYYLSAEKIRSTNPKCFFKTEPVSDRSEGLVRLSLEDGRFLLFKMDNLNPLEMISGLNKYVLPLVKVEKETKVATKAAKVAGGVRKNR